MAYCTASDNQAAPRGATPTFDVYCHTSPSGKRYVGWTSRGWRARWRKHVEKALAGSRFPLHCAIRKYGADAFTHELIDTVGSEAEAKRLEVEWIEGLGTVAPGGYNATAGGDGSADPSAYVRERIGRAHRGKTIPASQRAQISAALTGRKRGPFSAETCRRISVAQIGKTVSEESRRRMSEAQRKRPPASAETRARMSAAWTDDMRAEAARRLRKQRFMRALRVSWQRVEADLGIL